jgi:hypothetical protein
MPQWPLLLQGWNASKELGGVQAATACKSKAGRQAAPLLPAATAACQHRSLLISTVPTVALLLLAQVVRVVVLRCCQAAVEGVGVCLRPGQDQSSKQYKPSM